MSVLQPFAKAAEKKHSPYPAVRPGSGGSLTTTKPSQLTLAIDLSATRQTIQGFGASDCWSAQYVGQWPRDKRNTIADLLFETHLDPNNNPIGVGLSIWRMNLGAGSTRQNNIYDSWRRADCYLNAGLDGYDWTRCPGQRAMLHLAQARGVHHFIAFCNSPPFTMTKNSKTFCDPNSGSTNLRPACYNDFAVYLADVLDHFRRVEDINFTSLSPFNEPEWDWNENGNHPGHANQEGCRYSNADMSRFVKVLSAALKSRGLATKIELCEAGRIDFLYSRGNDKGNHIKQFFDPASPNFIGGLVTPELCTHSYGTDTPATGLVTKRQMLRQQLDRYHLDDAVSEYCILGNYGNGRDLGIDPALYMARTIHFDLTLAEATSWQWWLGVSPYDYKDGLVYIDKNKSDGHFYTSKMLWALGNYARFIRPGMVRVQVSRSDAASPADTVDGLMVSSYFSPVHQVVVTVMVNRGHTDRPLRLAYQHLPRGFKPAYQVPYVTSASDNLTAYAALKATDTIDVPARSIVTLVSLSTSP